MDFQLKNNFKFELVLNEILILGYKERQYVKFSNQSLKKTKY